MKTEILPSSSRQRGFSLIELIVVIAIIVVIASFTVPAASSVLRGSALTQASTMVISQISLARQQALTRNRAIEVRFYRYSDPEVPGEDVNDPSKGKFRGMQLFEVLENGVAVPLDKPQSLPVSVVFAYSEDDEGLSSLIDSAKAGTPKKPGTDDQAAPRLPRGIDFDYEYISFRFLQDGSTNLTPTGIWFLTLIGATDEGKKIEDINFFTLQIDPVSGSTRTFRPTAG